MVLAQKTRYANVYIIGLFIAINGIIKVAPIADLALTSSSATAGPLSPDTLAFGGGLFVVYMAVMYICFHGATVFDLVRVYSVIAQKNKPYYSIMFWGLRLLGGLVRIKKSKRESV